MIKTKYERKNNNEKKYEVRVFFLDFHIIDRIVTKNKKELGINSTTALILIKSASMQFRGSYA